MNRRRLITLLLVVVGAGALMPQSAVVRANQSQVRKLPESQEPELPPIVLTSELVKKFIATQDALRRLELRRPPGPIRSFVSDVALARALEDDPAAKGIFPEVGWSALEYARTQLAIVKTLMAMDELDSGDAKRLPDDVSEANVQFLRNVPSDVAVEFARWRQRTGIDQALQELQKSRRN